MQDVELIARYTDAAIVHGRASAFESTSRWANRADVRRTNRAADRIAAVYRTLRERDARELLLPLLGHPDHGVRGWAAAHALEFAPEDGERVLNELAEQDGMIGFNATTTLEVWRAGKLSFP